ncbi:MAG: transpeptidase family protein [Bacteroidales bacterium]|nr:transpeptidase family protein [Bacteroidales bacterium]HPD95533.1 penicillin-binding protein [Tenuifilaceae bacterium]HRX31132.1 penicillin-binding protein [Tenuifilaceae bacterium]
MSIKKDILTRVALIYIILLLIGISILIKVFVIQFVDGPELRDKAKAITYRNVVVIPSRGDILATDGRVLATSIPYYDIRMDLGASGLTDQLFKDNIDSLSICLSKFFGDRSRYSYRSEIINARKFAKNNRYYPVAPRRVDYIELQEIKKFPLFRLKPNEGGFIATQSNRRIFPNSDLAARTIGMVNKNGTAVGVEGAFDYALKGKAGLKVLERVPGNLWVEVKRMNEVDPEDGSDVITTIDINLQDVAEAALRENLSKHGADHGCAILMEVATGDIKAIANLKRNSDNTYSEMFNYAIGESAEPGSTMKIATLINLLEDGYINLDDSVNTGNGSIQLYDHTIQDSKKGGHGKISIKEVFEVSSNVGVIKLVQEHYKGKERQFVERWLSMKLNKPTGISVPGEPNPTIKFPGDKYWSGISLPMMSIGYEVKLTPLQMLTFYNAIANNGRMVKPRLVKTLINHGEIAQTYSPEIISSSICSRATLKKVREVLEGVVEHGTAQNLKNPRYKIAGKTGTAQLAVGAKGYKVNGSISYQASFAGYFPAEDPKYSCIVVVNSPSRSVYYGNIVAGPIFKEISDKVYATTPEWFREVNEEEELADLPESKNANRKSIEKIFNKLDIPYNNTTNNKSEWVRTVRDSSAVSIQPLRVIKGLVPNVRGMNIKDAVYLIEDSGMRVKFNGRGTVRSQSPAAGTKITPGGTVFLELTMSDN